MSGSSKILFMRDVEETFPSCLESVSGCSQFWIFRSPNFKINQCRGPGTNQVENNLCRGELYTCYEGPRPKKGFELPRAEAPCGGKTYISG